MFVTYSFIPLITTWYDSDGFGGFDGIDRYLQ